jgi:transcriptional regulator with XRE-family HTH domain
MSIPLPYFSLVFFIMGFKENLKDELEYTGMLVKELAATTGISKKTLDKYLLTNSCMPPADKAVAIAKALGVSVEYLVAGKKPYNTSKKEIQEFLSPEMRTIADIVEPLEREERKTIAEINIEVVKLLQAQEEDTISQALTPLQKVFVQLLKRK